MEKNFILIENEKAIDTVQIDNDVELNTSADSCTAFRKLGSLKTITLGDLKNMTLAELYYIQN